MDIIATILPHTVAFSSLALKDIMFSAVDD